MKKTILTLAVAAAGMTFASAASADFCGDYANSMVNINSQSARRGCNLTHPNWQGHYSWCLRNPPSRVNNALGAWQGRLNQCRPGSGGQNPGGQQLTDACKKVYNDYLKRKGPKAFAVSVDRMNCGRSNTARNVQEAQATAVRICANINGGACNIVDSSNR